MLPCADAAYAHNLVQALYEGQDYFDVDLSACDEEELGKYKAAVERGALELLMLVEEAVTSVLTRPGDHANLRVSKKSAETWDSNDLTKHAKFRFTAYSLLKDQLGYGGGSRIPLPSVCEALVKAVLPGDKKFTGFLGGGRKRERDAEGAPDAVE